MPGASEHRQKQVRLFLFVLAGAGILAVTAITINAFTWFRLDSNVRQLQGVRQLAVDWNIAMSLVKDIEIGQRGFLLTGEVEFLKPYERAVADLPTQWDIIKDRKDDEGKLSDQVDQARALANLVIQSAQETILLERMQTDNRGAKIQAIERGKEAMDKLRNLLERELKTLNETTFTTAAQMRSDLKTGLLSAIATGISALGLGGTAFVLIRRIFREMRRTDRYAAERTRAEKADREKSSFLAMMSHEVRTPLNAILGFGELIGDQTKNALIRRHAHSIVGSGRALLQLLNDILDISKLESGMTELHLSPVSLKDLSRSVVSIFQETATSKKLVLECDFSDDLPNSFLLDEARLRQVLINLVGNAIKFTEVGQVRLKICGTPEPADRSIWDLLISVSDTGPGIRPEEKARIFKPFVQSELDEKFSNEGVGLGLAIVQRFVRFMRGKITVKSEPGEGAVFTVSLKGVEVSNRLPQAVVKVDRDVDFNALRASTILAVDDNETNLELLRSIFLSTHHEIFVATSGAEALELLDSIEPDLILMDIRMPGMDGVTALKAIRSESRYRMLPVVAVTASSRLEDEVPDRAGFDGCVRKPFSRRELFDAMAGFLEARAVGKHQEKPETADPEAWRGLLDQLKSWESGRWIALREGMALSEVNQFAGDLLKAAETAECPLAIEYATELAAAGDAFAFAEMEERVRRFPDLIADLKRQIES